MTVNNGELTFDQVYWNTGSFDLNDALNPQQPFVLSNGDPTGYGYHGGKRSCPTHIFDETG